jgi:hypothetical protein
MVVLLVLGLVLWALTGPVAFVVCVVGIGLARWRWDRSYRAYLRSMTHTGRKPFLLRHWTLIGDSLVHSGRSGALAAISRMNAAGGSVRPR